MTIIDTSKFIDERLPEPSGADIVEVAYRAGYNQALADMRDWLARRYADGTIPKDDKA